MALLGTVIRVAIIEERMSRPPLNNLKDYKVTWRCFAPDSNVIKRCCEYGNIMNLWSVNKLRFSASFFFPFFLNASMGSFKDAIVQYEFFLLLTRTVIYSSPNLDLPIQLRFFSGDNDIMSKNS